MMKTMVSMVSFFSLPEQKKTESSTQQDLGSISGYDEADPNHNKITPFNWYRLNHPKNALKLLSNNTQYIVTPQMYQQKNKNKSQPKVPAGLVE
jgi:hypothetical protein